MRGAALRYSATHQQEVTMHRSFPGALLIALALAPRALEADAPDALQAQLPAPPPLVPERQRPRVPLFPTPQIRVPTARPPVGFATGVLLPVCGPPVLVDPRIDPKFVKPVPDSGVKYTIRELPVPIPCR
jgi:hypothetical protein